MKNTTPKFDSKLQKGLISMKKQIMNIVGTRCLSTNLARIELENLEKEINEK